MHAIVLRYYRALVTDSVLLAGSPLIALMVDQRWHQSTKLGKTCLDLIAKLLSLLVIYSHFGFAHFSIQ